VQHTVNWPVSSDVYAGSFLYHMAPNLIHIGYVVGLDYKNPYLNPYEEFQQLKTHKEIRPLLEGGECISYGARCLNEGGFHAIPKLTFPGGMLAGCSAGFLNVAKIKGSHTAMKTGMLAAESIFNRVKDVEELDVLDTLEVSEYESSVMDSWVAEELKASRNFKGGFDKGLWAGLAHGGIV
jgi:electron-transferring-flavoprotein dehydrogenase